MSDRNPIAEEFLRRLPLPLAQLYRRAHNAKTARDAHDFAFYVWEAALKLLAAAAIVNYKPDDLLDPKISAALQNLSRPALGQWWELARLLVPIHADRNIGSYPVLNELLFGRARSDLPRCAGLMTVLDAALGRPVSGRTTLRVGELFDRLIEHRNKGAGHGAPAGRTGDFFRPLANALRLAATELFERFDVLAGRKLVYVSDVRPIRDAWLVERSELTGVVPWRIESLELQREKSEPPPLNEGVYLSDPERPDDAKALVALVPLISYDVDAETVLFLNSRRGGRRVEFLCYITGRTSDLSRVGGLSRLHLAPGESPGADLIADEIPPADSLGANGQTKRIGEFELLSELGRGAMGIVYRAWQPSLGREVALKVQPRPGDAKADARFRREIRALGRVDHPHVVKVYTSGTDGEQFYYTMELVEGAPLSAVSAALTQAGTMATAVDLPVWRQALGQACAAAREAESPLSSSDGSSSRAGPGSKTLATDDDIDISVPEPGEQTWALEPAGDYVRQVVELVRQTAEAAHALHERGVIHRDIKPGNVLVSADGTQAVLMDLGLAQLADDVEGRITRTCQFVGTLRYASPQQVIARGSLDRRTDVYSLGATLYELLSLRPMFGATDATPMNTLMEMITRDEPERLGKVAPAVGRDLEAIVHKCLEKSVEGRYATAADLANDLGRWLQGEPVKARPVRGWERAWKWMKRRPVASGLSAALVLALFGGAITAWTLAVYARHEAITAQGERDRANCEAIKSANERDRAVAARARTRDALDAMTSIVAGDALTTQAALSEEQKGFLRSVVRYYEEFAAEPGEDREAIERVAAAHFRLGTINFRLGQADKGAVEMTKAVGLYRKLATENSNAGDTFPRSRLAVSYGSLGVMQAALGHRAEAESAYRSAIEAYSALAEKLPGTSSLRWDLARCEMNLGALLGAKGQRSDAEAAFGRALGLAEKLAAEPTALPDHRRLLGAVLNNIGALHETKSRRVEAEAAYRRAIAVQAPLAAEFPRPQHLQELSRSQTNLGRVLEPLGNPSEAESAYRAALVIQKKLVADYPSAPEFRRTLAITHTSLGVLLGKQGKAAAAREEQQAALIVQEKLIAEFPAIPEYKIGFGNSCSNLANQLSDGGDAAAALPWFTKAVTALEAVYSTDARTDALRGFLCNSHWGRARALSRAHRGTEAVPDWDRALELVDARLRTDLQAERAAELARAGAASPAAAAAAEVSADAKASNNALYNAACGLALASALDSSLSDCHAANAVVLLRRLMAKGFRDTGDLLKDNDFAALRRHPEFDEFLWCLAEMRSR